MMMMRVVIGHWRADDHVIRKHPTHSHTHTHMRPRRTFALAAGLGIALSHGVSVGSLVVCWSCLEKQKRKKLLLDLLGWLRAQRAHAPLPKGVRLSHACLVVVVRREWVSCVPCVVCRSQSNLSSSFCGLGIITRPRQKQASPTSCHNAATSQPLRPHRTHPTDIGIKQPPQRMTA